MSRTSPPTTGQMVSSIVARASAVFLVVVGLPLLFASDVILPSFMAGFPPSATWLGQLIAASWLSVAIYNWNSRHTVLGGIYGRPSVNLNLVLYLVSALGMLKVANASAALRALTVPFVILAAIYGLLLFRGPFDRPATT